MKKLMLLGGSKYLLPAIEAAHQMDIYVITCDYLPDNVAHKHSDAYYNVSIIDKDAVLNLAKELKIDGIMSYATDPGVVTAAYVAKEMNLPGNPYESIKILQNKGLFREFLKKNNFNVPLAKSFSEITELDNCISDFTFPVMIKPVDSAGSKGVTKVNMPDELEKAITYAKSFSLTGKIIIEEFIEKEGASSDTDCFSIDGELCFCSFNDQWFDESAANPYTPSAFLWPSSMPLIIQQELKQEIQRLIKLLNLKTTIYNIETRLGKNGKAYIMEMAPRAGGNRLAEMLKYASGQDLISNAVRSALGMPLVPLSDPEYNGWWGECVLHSNQNGIFKKLEISPEIQDSIFEEDLWITPGTKVSNFTGANESIGTIVLKCKTQQQLKEFVKNIDQYIAISVLPAEDSVL